MTMVAANEVFRVADELLAQRKLVSVRKVREQLPDPKGSHEDINPLLDRWKRERNYKPSLARMDLPKPMEKALAAFARQVRAAEDTLGQELARLRIENDALKRQVEHLTAENAGQRREPSDCLEAAGRQSSPEQPLKGRRYGISQATALAFWDLVMREIVQILGDRAMTIDEIVDAIDPFTKAFAAEHFTPVRLGVVDQQMRYRARLQRYFIVDDDGRFRRKPKRGRPSQAQLEFFEPPA